MRTTPPSCSTEPSRSTSSARRSATWYSRIQPGRPQPRQLLPADEDRNADRSLEDPLQAASGAFPQIGKSEEPVRGGPEQLVLRDVHRVVVESDLERDDEPVPSSQLFAFAESAAQHRKIILDGPIPLDRPLSEIPIGLQNEGLRHRAEQIRCFGKRHVLRAPTLSIAHVAEPQEEVPHIQFRGDPQLDSSAIGDARPFLLSQLPTNRGQRQAPPIPHPEAASAMPWCRRRRCSTAGSAATPPAAPADSGGAIARDPGKLLPVLAAVEPATIRDLCLGHLRPMPARRRIPPPRAILQRNPPPGHTDSDP